MDNDRDHLQVKQRSCKPVRCIEWLSIKFALYGRIIRVSLGFPLTEKPLILCLPLVFYEIKFQALIEVLIFKYKLDFVLRFYFFSNYLSLVLIRYFFVLLFSTKIMSEIF